MEGEIEKEESGVTLGYIFRTIFSEKWLALIIAAAITIFGTLGLYFMGKRNVVYSVSFVLQLPSTGETDSTSTSYKYPDGSSFYFTDLISAKNLREIASREGFTGIDVDKIAKRGDISITRAVDNVSDNLQSGVYDLNYTIKVKAKYFDGEDIARDFIEELVSIPREHICAMTINYDQSLTASKSLITYDGRLDALTSQAEYLLSKYDDFISSYGKDFVVKEGNTLGYYQRQLQTFLTGNSTLDNLKTKALTNQFVMSDENGQPLAAAIEQYAADLLTKKDERDKLQGALDRLYVGSEGQTSVIVDATVLDCAMQVEKLNKEIEYFEKFTAENCKADETFDKEVKAAEGKVEAFTREFSEIASIVYTNKTTVNYLNSSVVAVEGGRGLIISVGLSFVAGLVVAAVVAYIVGWNKQKKAGGASAAAPEIEEAQLQAAATDAEDKEDKK